MEPIPDTLACRTRSSHLLFNKELLKLIESFQEPIKYYTLSLKTAKSIKLIPFRILNYFVDNQNHQVSNDKLEFYELGHISN